MTIVYAVAYLFLLTLAGHTLGLATDNGYLGSFVVFAGGALFCLLEAP